MRRYRLLLNIKNYVNEADNSDLGDFTVTFTPNLPKAVLEELKALADAGAEFSQETLLELASFVEDAQAELDKVKKERKEAQETAIDQRMFGVNENGQEQEQLKHNITEEVDYRKHIGAIYGYMMDQIQKEINGFYARYAKKEGITLTEAKKRVSRLDMEEYERKAAKYVKDKDFSAEANEEMRL